MAERCEVSRQTASSWLHALVEAGLLRDTKIGRELLFVNHEFLAVLTRPEWKSGLHQGPLTVTYQCRSGTKPDTPGAERG